MTYARLSCIANCPLFPPPVSVRRMAARIPIALGDIRAAISKARRVRLAYESANVVADLYLLGQARKTGAYVIIAWCLEPVKEWRLLRYSLIKDFEQVGVIDAWRNDFDPGHPKLGTVDTIAFRPPRKQHG